MNWRTKLMYHNIQKYFEDILVGCGTLIVNILTLTAYITDHIINFVRNPYNMLLIVAFILTFLVMTE